MDVIVACLSRKQKRCCPISRRNASFVIIDFRAMQTRYLSVGKTLFWNRAIKSRHSAVVRYAWQWMCAVTLCFVCLFTCWYELLTRRLLYLGRTNVGIKLKQLPRHMVDIIWLVMDHYNPRRLSSIMLIVVIGIDIISFKLKYRWNCKLRDGALTPCG